MIKKSDGALVEPVHHEADTAIALETNAQMHRAVWKMSWPTLAANLLNTLNGILDAFFVGGLPHSRQALAATGTGGQIMFLLISFAIGLSIGTSALVSRFVGANDQQQASRAVGQSISLSALIGALLGLACILLRGPLILLVLGRSSSLSSIYCSQFLAIALLATAPTFLTTALMGAFRGMGDMRTPLRVQCCTIVVHMSCDWLLIYGRFGLPRMGVTGAGTALALATMTGMILYLLILFRRKEYRSSFTAHNLWPSLSWYQRILRISIPAAIRGVARTLAMLLYTAMLARTQDGSAAVSAISIGIRAEAIAFMPGIGYSIATSTLVGQSLGALNPTRAERATRAAMLQAMLVMGIVAIVFLFFAPQLCRIFTSDKRVLVLGAAYLRINAISEPIFGMGIVLQGALQGAGDTMRPTWITMISMWCLRIPLGWLLMFPAGMGAIGAWLAMCISSIVNNFLLVPLYRSGKWKTQKV